jgi:hypothetical protein
VWRARYNLKPVSLHHHHTIKDGVLRFLGETKFKDGVWAGVQLDFPEVALCFSFVFSSAV